MNKKLKIFLWILLGIVILAVLMAGWAAIDPMRYKKLVVNDVILDDIPDGVYEGSFKGGRFSNSVEVTIKDHKIVDIKKVGSPTPTDKLYSQIYDKIIEKQSLNIDAVSGASITTKTSLKAVENALRISN